MGLQYLIDDICENIWNSQLTEKPVDGGRISCRWTGVTLMKNHLDMTR